MHFTQLDAVAIAQAELEEYLEQYANKVAPETPSLVAAEIKVERVGFTRNASNTPYIVYWVKNRRWSTFIARSRFMELVQVLLKLKHKIEDRIRTVASSPDFGLSVTAGENQKYIPSSYLNRFFERYNKVALERIQPLHQCDCQDLFDMCLHQISQSLHTLLEEKPTALFCWLWQKPG